MQCKDRIQGSSLHAVKGWGRSRFHGRGIVPVPNGSGEEAVVSVICSVGNYLELCFLQAQGGSRRSL